MVQGFEKTKPEYRIGLSSDMFRTQLNALCSHHEGISEPGDLQKGMIWLDTGDSNNWKIKLRTESSWVTLFENVQILPGVPGGSSQFEFTQESPVNPWSIVHNKGRRILSVIVVDSLYRTMNPSSYTVEYVDANNLTITFTTGPTSGKAYLF